VLASVGAPQVGSTNARKQQRAYLVGVAALLQECVFAKDDNTWFHGTDGVAIEAGNGGDDVIVHDAAEIVRLALDTGKFVSDFFQHGRITGQFSFKRDKAGDIFDQLLGASDLSALKQGGQDDDAGAEFSAIAEYFLHILAGICKKTGDACLGLDGIRGTATGDALYQIGDLYHGGQCQYAVSLLNEVRRMGTSFAMMSHQPIVTAVYVRNKGNRRGSGTAGVVCHGGPGTGRL